MNTTTAYNHQLRLEGVVKYIYSAARSAGMSHQWILGEMKAKVWDDPALVKAPSWVKLRLQHTSEFLADELYRPRFHAHDLERMLTAAKAGQAVKPVAYVYWQHRLNGKFISSEEISEISKAGDREVWDRIESNHIWNHNHNDFGEWKPTKA